MDFPNKLIKYIGFITFLLQILKDLLYRHIL